MSEDITVTAKTEPLFSDESFKDMVDAGVFFGTMKSKTHPRMKQYVLTTRNGIDIVDLGATKEFLEKASNFLKEKITGGASVLLVGTQPSAEGIAAIAAELQLPVVTRRWLGGTLTNFKVIAKRIEYFKKLKSDWAAKAFEQYTKKEKLGIEGELRRLQDLLAGVQDLASRPGVLLVIDPRVHRNAVREARLLHIPVVAFVNTDVDPESVDYPVPGNTKARSSVQWFLGKMKEAVIEAKRAAAATATAAEPAPAGAGASPQS